MGESYPAPTGLSLRLVLCVFPFLSAMCFFRYVAVILKPCSFHCSDDRMQFSSSQPDSAAGGWEAMLLIGQGQVSFSQPTKPEHMLLCSQLLGTPGASQVIHVFSIMSVCKFLAGQQGIPHVCGIFFACMFYKISQFRLYSKQSNAA